MFESARDGERVFESERRFDWSGLRDDSCKWLLFAGTDVGRDVAVVARLTGAKDAHEPRMEEAVPDLTPEPDALG
jgi:hypothetical protein